MNKGVSSLIGKCDVDKILITAALGSCCPVQPCSNNFFFQFFTEVLIQPVVKISSIWRCFHFCAGPCCFIFSEIWSLWYLWYSFFIQHFLFGFQIFHFNQVTVVHYDAPRDHPWGEMCCVNSLWPGDSIWQHRSGSTMVHVMACCLAAPSHYLNQYCLIITIEFCGTHLWLISQDVFKISICKMSSKAHL